MSNDLTIISQNSKLALAKVKSLLDITNKILDKKDSDNWIERLFLWADDNEIPDYIWVEDEDFDEGGYYNGIPRNKTKLLKLEILRLFDLEIEQLPDELFDLLQLKELKIKNCGLQTISSKISNLENLENLYLAKNSLFTLPDELKNLSKLKEVHLHTNHFQEIPEVLYDLQQLNHICLNNCKIQTISERIGNLQFLEELFLRNNQISELPDTLYDLKNLKKLSCSDNLIEAIDDNIKLLTDLEDLSLYNNKLNNLPNGIFELKNLKDLRLHSNDLTTLSSDIYNFSNLEFLTIGGNTNLQALPDNIVALNKINLLFLSENPNLILTLDQIEWIKDLESRSEKIYYDEDLFSRNKNYIPTIDIDDDEIPF